MGQTRAQIKATVRVNLDDAGVTFWQEIDLNDALQDAYDDICALSQCIVKKADHLSWPVDLVYINAVTVYGLNDYLSVIAIFNYNTNRWLRDDLSLRNFDQIRRDWELWRGTPEFWAPASFQSFAVAPSYGPNPTGTFKLLYSAGAPELTDESSVFLMASDVQNMLEFYTTADMLEQAQEFSKASAYWDKYYSSLVEYSERVKANNKADLLLRV